MMGHVLHCSPFRGSAHAWHLRALLAEPRGCGRWLLATIVALGLLCGVSFSASYQLVAYFANKNTISLGLGCVLSGLVVLGLETLLQIGPSPAHWQLVVLFEACAGERQQVLHV